MSLSATVILSADEERSRRDELEERLRWLIRLRWIALGGVFFVIGLARWLGLVQSSTPLLITGAAMVVINVVFFIARVVRPDRTLRELSAEALLQIFVDVTGLGLLLFFAGGLSNPFVFFFTFHVVIAAILLEKRQAYSAALISTGVVVFLGLAEELGLSKSWPLQGLSNTQDLSALSRMGMVFALSTTQIISVYLVTAIMDRLRARTADVRRLNRDLEDRVERVAAAERRLAAEHQRARAILECMKEGVVVVDLEGRVLLANSAAQQSAVLALEETLKRTDLNAPASLPESPKLAQIEIKGRFFENTLSAVRAASGETLGLMVVSRDVTERRSLERQVTHAEKLHALGNLAAGLAHELNTPLGTILGYAQMLLEDRERTELKVIEEQARRCRKIVQGLLVFARKSSGGRAHCKPADLITKVRELLSHPMKMRGLTLEALPSSPFLPSVDVASDEIEQVLVNLVTNAADSIELSRVALQPALALAHAGTSNGTATPETPPDSPQSSSGTIRLAAGLDARGRVVLSVEDDGPGVPTELRDQIFEPFFTTKEAGRGTGLGLSIARRIVEDHGGELALETRSDGSHGARFELRLPLTTAIQPVS